MITVDWQRFIYDRVWFGYTRCAVWVTPKGWKHEYGEWKWKWVKVTCD